MNPDRTSFFPIGTWFEGKPEWSGCPKDITEATAWYRRQFSVLANYGFNAVVVPNCPETHWKPLLSCALEKDVKIILEIESFAAFVNRRENTEEQEIRTEVRRVVDQIGTYRSLLLYQVRDEPELWMMETWERVNHLLRQEDPKRGGFSCFAHPAALRRAAQSSELETAVFDIYPLFEDTPHQTLGNFTGCLNQVVQEAGNRPIWTVLQSFAKPGWWRMPGEQEIRSMTYTSLAAGVKGLFYFLYPSLPHHPEQLLGLIRPDGSPAALYTEVQKLILEIRKLSPLLASLRPDPSAATFTDTVKVSTFMEHGSPILIPNSIKGDIRIGTFQDTQNRQVIIIASLRPAISVKVQVDSVKTGVWINALTDQPIQVKNGHFIIDLAPGDGCILLHTN